MQMFDCHHMQMFDCHQMQMFDGLEEDDASSFGNDSFVARHSIKKLLIKKTPATLDESILAALGPLADQ